MGCDKEFWVAIKPSGSVSQHGPLCHDMAHRLYVAPGSQQGLMSQHSLAKVGENLYHDREFSGLDRVGHDKGGQARTSGAQCNTPNYTLVVLLHV